MILLCKVASVELVDPSTLRDPVPERYWLSASSALGALAKLDRIRVARGMRKLDLERVCLSICDDNYNAAGGVFRTARYRFDHLRMMLRDHADASLMIEVESILGSEVQIEHEDPTFWQLASWVDIETPGIPGDL